MIVPPVERWTAGEVVDSDVLNQRSRDVLEFLLEPPQACAKQTVAQSIPTVTWRVIDLDTTEKDNDGIVDLSLNRLTIQTPGWYEIETAVSFDLVDSTNDPKGRRISAIQLNGSPANGGRRGRRDACPPTAGALSCRPGGSFTAMFLNIGDYLELLAFQDSTVSRNTRVGNTEEHPFIAVRWVSN